MTAVRPSGPRTGFSGVYPMLYAFFDTEDQLDREAMRRQVDAMVGAGAHGIAVLGLATESNKLTDRERRTLLDWAAEDLAGRRPLSVTIPGANLSEQIALGRAAIEAGASWLVLQPPPVKDPGEAALVDYFGTSADALAVPVGVQIAPEYLGGAISGATLGAFGRRHPNVRILKVEMTALRAAELVAATEGTFDIFNGHAGVELTDSLRAGCVGVIPGAECTDVLVRILEDFRSGDAAARRRADAGYQAIAPLLTFLMQSLDTFLVYGKRIMARRLGLPDAAARVRAPTGAPMRLGLEIAAHWSRDLPPFPGAG